MGGESGDTGRVRGKGDKKVHALGRRRRRHGRGGSGKEGTRVVGKVRRGQNKISG